MPKVLRYSPHLWLGKPFHSFKILIKEAFIEA